MQKIVCPKTGKGVWLTKAMMDNMRTLKILGVDTIEAPAVSIRYQTAKLRTHHMGNYYSVQYIGDNKWRFEIKPVSFSW